MAWPQILDHSLMGARMLPGLPRFLRQPPPDLGHSRAALQQSLRDRARAFLSLLRHGVYEHAASPYLPLLRQADLTYDTCERLVRDHGVEGALERFYDAGVHVSLDEFKGRSPIRRGAIVVPPHARACGCDWEAMGFAARLRTIRSYDKLTSEGMHFIGAESSSRAAAFLAGGVDAGGLELSSWLWLQKQAPGRFVVLSDFAARWPAIKTTGVHVNRDFARDHRDLVHQYLTALLAANRAMLADPQRLASAARDHMGRAEDWDATARIYIDAHAWPVRGGLMRADVDTTLTFFRTRSRLDPRLTVDGVADLGFLEGVLADSRE